MVNVNAFTLVGPGGPGEPGGRDGQGGPGEPGGPGGPGGPGRLILSFSGIFCLLAFSSISQLKWSIRQIFH